MAQQYPEISDKLANFIARQKIFFVGTAARDGRINVSPKGMNSLRILNPNRVIWLNVTGSGNETAAHVQEDPRMTLMFCALEGDPLILRLYGQAQVVHQKDVEWGRLFPLLQPLSGARQIFDLSVDLVQTSCGMGVPFYDYAGERQQLTDWADKKGPEGLKDYWVSKNQTSIDGKPTHILSKNIS